METSYFKVPVIFVVGALYEPYAEYRLMRRIDQVSANWKRSEGHEDLPFEGLIKFPGWYLPNWPDDMGNLQNDPKAQSIIQEGRHNRGDEHYVGVPRTLAAHPELLNLVREYAQRLAQQVERNEVA